MTAKLVTGPWRLGDLKAVPKNGYSVFSCFHCGGGSTMGYKLAGYTVLGGVEIDPAMMRLYRENHKPRHSFLMGVREFVQAPKSTLPDELYRLDILDGSPPCSSFAMLGDREAQWGKEKKFREGQAKQVLDDLFFDFIDIAEKLKPKVVVAENVKGLILGNARGYVKEIFKRFDSAGYNAQLFLLDASRMGVPQMRQRVFFLARRKDLHLPEMQLAFNEPVISCREAWKDLPANVYGKPLTGARRDAWYNVPNGVCFNAKGTRNTIPKDQRRLHPNKPAFTQPAGYSLSHWQEPCYLTPMQAIRVQSFPDDYNFLKCDPTYVCGMSVPPLMMQRVADQITQQWLSRLNNQLPGAVAHHG